MKFMLLQSAVLALTATIAASAQNIPKYVLASQGADAVRTGQFLFFGTLGQPVTGIVTNGSQSVSQGYWTPLPVTTSSQEAINPSEFILNVFPLPFADELTIEYSLTSAGKVSLRIVDGLGREISHIEEQYRHIGKYRIVWHPSDQLKASMASGAYFMEYICSSPNSTDVRRTPLLMLR